MAVSRIGVTSFAVAAGLALAGCETVGDTVGEGLQAELSGAMEVPGPDDPDGGRFVPGGYVSLNGGGMTLGLITGVNSDEEAISLVQYQQMYQANMRVIAIANQLFDATLQMVQ